MRLHRFSFGQLLLAPLVACSTKRAPEPAPPVSVASDLPIQPLILSVVSTNDVHGHLKNLPRLGGFVANLRRARAEDGGGVLLLDGGDTLQGELASNLNEGAAVVDAYNALGYAAAAVGNHEFDFGPVGPTASPKPGEDPRGALKARAAQANYPLLVSNLTDTSTGQPFTAPHIAASTLVEVAGIQVGLVGALTLETTQSVLASVFDGLELTPLATSVEREAERLRQRGATVVVVLAHAGGQCQDLSNPDDLSSCDPHGEIFDVARTLRPGLVDAIVSGHTHTKLGHRVNGIPVIQSGAHGDALARVDLLIDRASRRVLRDEIYAPIEVCTPAEGQSGCLPASYEERLVEEDVRVSRIVQAAFEVADRRRNEQLGVQLSTPFERAYGAESSLSNLVADLMRKARPRVDITLMHSGGLRADLPAGQLDYGRFYETYPRDSTFAIATMTGAQLAFALEANFTGPRGLLASISGARVEARCEQGRLRVMVRRENGRPIQPTEKVVVATNNLLAAGAKGPLGGVPWAIEDEPPIREELVNVIRRQGGNWSALEPSLFDPTKPRVRLPGPAPVDCAAGDSR